MKINIEETSVPKIDYSSLINLALCDNGSLTFKFRNSEYGYGVYVIRFPDGQFYIGQSKQLHRRIYSHYYGFVHGSKVCLPQLKEAFYDNNRCFEVYLLSENPKGLKEADYIIKFLPTLNRGIPINNTNKTRDPNPDPIYMDIKKIIKSRKMTLTDVGRKMGISQSGVSQLLSGNLTLAKLRELSDILECSIADFFADEVKDKNDFIALVKDGDECWAASSWNELTEIVNKHNSNPIPADDKH